MGLGDQGFQERMQMPGRTSILQQVEDLKQHGNSIIEHNPGEAFYLYSEAIHLVHQFDWLFSPHPREVVKLYSSRCLALMKIRDYWAALEDASACTRIDPSFYKGYWQVAMAAKQMDRKYEAIKALINGYPKILDSAKKAVSHRIDFVYEVTVLAVRLWKEWKQSQSLFKSLVVTTSVWTQVVQRLARNKEYHGLRLVFLGGSTAFAVGKGGVATGCDTSALDLHPIVCDLSSVSDKWAVHLVFELIKHGSKIGGLHLHCAVENVLNSGSSWIELLKYLLDNVYKTSESRNLPDSFGNSLFHLVAKTTGPFAKIVVDTLRQYGVDPSKLDKRGRKPVDLVPQKFYKLRHLLKNDLKAWNQGLELEKQQEQQQQQQQNQPHAKKGPQEVHVQNETGHQRERSKEEERRFNDYQKGLSLQEEDKHDEAVCHFLEFISKEHKNGMAKKDVNECVKALLKSLDHVQEITGSVECAAPPAFWNNTVQELADSNNWWGLFLLIVGSGRAEQNGRGTGIAHGCDASGVSIVAFLSHLQKLQKTSLNPQAMVEALLENHANPNGMPKDPETPLATCLRTEKYELVNLLLMRGAVPSESIADCSGKLLHSALKTGFKQNDQNFTLLKFLLEKYSPESASVIHLDKNAQDTEGNTLFHVALACNDKDQSLNAIKLLSTHKLNPQLPNQEGRVPLKMVSVDDCRHSHLQEAAKHYEKPDLGSRQDRHSTKPTKSYKEELQQEVRKLIKRIPDFVCKQSDAADARTPVKPQPKSPAVQLATCVAPDRDEVPKQQQTTEEEDNHLDDEGGDKDKGEEEETPTDANLFDGLPWEIVCSTEVCSFLRNKKVPHSFKKAAIRKIQILGSGDWRGRLCKPLEGQAKQHNMKLYEARLTKGGRILWELVIAFSPRCSKKCEKRLKSGGGLSEDTAIYSEIIRVWDIVCDHDKVAHAIDVIVKSAERCEEYIIPKNLVGFSNKEASEGSALRLPTYYRKATGSLSDQEAKFRQVDMKELTQHTSSRENEYHIRKFYSVTSSLINAMLSDSSVKVDFPFRENEQEHAIINLQPKPPSSILLLGRSGTGKTTCCLYRLWTKFFIYWQQASKAGGPLFHRNIAFIHQDKTSEDTVGDDSGEGSQPTATRTSQVDGASGFSGEHFDSDITSANLASSTNGESGDSSDGSGTPIMDHLHQIFVTKNAVLCSEIQRNFSDMARACEFATEPSTQQDTPIPNRLQDAHQAQFPLFLSSRQFLLLLDASLPDPFFPRAADGSLKQKIQGWNEEDGPLTFIPLMDDDEDEDEDNTGGADEDATQDEVPLGDNIQPNAPTKYNPRREVTYEVFAHELWPQIKKDKELRNHAPLVWMEIISFIKGSVEALHSDSGFLSFESYKELGLRRAPNFTANREKVYSLFEKYQRVKRRKQMFDGSDLVYNVYQRLKDVTGLDWAIHEIYVDETQDFTQAELALFIRCAQDPNALFFTGDTAQSIMRGVAFRFKDLRSLFHYASQSARKESDVTVPEDVYQLTRNYRSHAGILNLASTIVDMMAYFFPDSFDHLKRDEGLLPGHPPVLLESCSVSDLAVLLCGNKRQTSEIEFGAHQVILVANQRAIEELPEELQSSLVMTIYEAKGLEFDDVLLYNFFKDSEADDKEWQVITSYLKELIAECQNTSNHPKHPKEALQKLDVASLTSTSQLRPRKFNPGVHKALNSELKRLYTAITRARANVWIFDEDESKRAPMFELFRCLKLVEVFRLESDEDAAGSTGLDTMFVQKSTNSDWIKRGDNFFQNKYWKLAAKCYERGGDDNKKLKAQAYQHASDGEHMRKSPQNMREKFLLAASLFLCCDSSKMAVNCLKNAREFWLLAQLFEKRGEFSEAAKIYEKHLKNVGDACRCLERIGDYAKAVDLLCSIGMHSKALDVVDRFKQFKEEKIKKEGTLPRHIKQPGLSNLDEMMYKSAEYHCKQYKTTTESIAEGSKGLMLDALKELGQFEARVNFLRNRGLIREAVEMLQTEGRKLEAAKLLREQGNLEEACTILDSSDNREFVAECWLSQARKLLLEAHDEKNQAAAISFLNKAEDLFNKCSESFKKAETQLLLGQLHKDTDRILKAKHFFNKMSHTAGESECIDQLLKLCPYSIKEGDIFQPLEHLLQLICALLEYTTVDEQRQGVLCQEFFGLVLGKDDYLNIQRHEGARVLSKLGKSLPQRSSKVKAVRARQGIVKHFLIPRALNWVEFMRKPLQQKREKLTQCRDYVIGMQCSKTPEMCQNLHEPYSRHNILGLVDSLVKMIEIDDIMERASRVSKFRCGEELSAEIEQTKESKFEKCEALYDVFFPKHCHHRFIGESLPKVKDFLRKVRMPVIKEQMMALVWNSRAEANSLRRRADTDLYLMCHNIHQLMGEGSKVIEDLVTQEEGDCLTKKENRKYWRPLGMHPLDIPKPLKGYMYSSYKRRHLESFEHLYSKCNAVESFGSFNAFMGTPANKPENPLLPSISNTVAMIEARVTLALTIGAKFQRCSVAIPASYLAQTSFFDVMCCPRPVHAMYFAVSQTTTKISYGRLQYLVGLVCGSGKTGSKFNILADAFSSVDHINTGEAERTLVLVLVMLCNAGLGFPVRISGDIRGALLSLAIPDHLPKRVQTALDHIKAAQCRHDALRTLQNLLRAREDEYLRECRWSQCIPPCGTPGLEYQPLHINSFKNIGFETISPTSPSAFTEQAKSNMDKMGKFEDEDRNLSEEKGEDLVDDSKIEDESVSPLPAETAAKVQNDQKRLREEKALSIIVAFLKSLKLLRLAKVLRSRGLNKIRIQQGITPADAWVSKQLLELLPTPMRCSLCSVDLRVVQVLGHEQDDIPESFDEEETEDETEEVSEETHEPQCPTQEEHESTPLHQDRQGHLQMYMGMLRNEVYPLHTVVEKLLQDIHLVLRADASERTSSLKFHQEKLSRSLEVVTSKMDEIQRKRAFKQLEEVRHVLHQLQDTHKTVRGIYQKYNYKPNRQRRAQQKQSEASSLDVKDPENLHVGGDDSEEEIIPIARSSLKGSRNTRKNPKRKGKKR